MKTNVYTKCNVCNEHPSDVDDPHPLTMTDSRLPGFTFTNVHPVCKKCKASLLPMLHENPPGGAFKLYGEWPKELPRPAYVPVFR